MDIAEVYRVVYDGPQDRLRGAILACDTETGFQYLFKDESIDISDPKEFFIQLFDIDNQVEIDKKSNMMIQPCIKSGGHIMLTGPSEASIGFMPDFALTFFLFGDIKKSLTIERPLHSKDLSVPLEGNFMTGEGKILTILYALFDKAVEAHVKVMISNVNSAFDLNGVIAARTSAIKDPAYSSILFFKGEDDKFQVKPGNGNYELLLSRSIVGVPLGAELILQFLLCSHGRGEIVKHIARINVTPAETNSKTVCPIPCRNQCLVEAEIIWKSKREFKPY